jgi:hypothetical protein
MLTTIREISHLMAIFNDRLNASLLIFQSIHLIAEALRIAKKTTTQTPPLMLAFYIGDPSN